MRPASIARPVLIAAFAVRFTLVPAALFAAADARPPNVVLVMTDDQGYGDLGCHGNPVIRTPALDRLHAQSVRLTNYHVDPTCSPTRAALLTGRYSSRTGVWHTIMGRSILHRDETTAADVFKANGYRCGCFGKWHLGDNRPYRPQDRGFHDVLIHGGGGVGQTPDWFGNDYFDDVYFRAGAVDIGSPLAGVEAAGRQGRPVQMKGYCTDVFFDAALAFIERNRERPFFCYLPTNAAHGPFRVAKKYSQPYTKLGVPSPRAEFYGMITNIDENMARLEEKLNELDMAENTIVIFTTDNGTAAGFGGRRRRGAAGAAAQRSPASARNPASASSRASEKARVIRQGYNAGMRGTKGSEYDGGHRVPFFIRWPAGGIGGGRDVPELTAHIDVLPTLIELCGLKPPREVRFDGISLAPLLRVSTHNRQQTTDNSNRQSSIDNHQSPIPLRTLFVHSQRIEHPRKWRKAAVMTDRWRLVLDGDRRELFDMHNDPGQRHDVAARYPDLFARLATAYEKWYADVGERFDGYVRIPLGAPEAPVQHLTCHDWHTDNGPVPWNQTHIRSDQRANGFWAVEVVRPGKYEITLRTRPAYAEQPLGAVKARARIGEADASRTVSPKSQSVTIPVTLAAGRARLQTRLEDERGRSRGAYFVEVRRIE